MQQDGVCGTDLKPENHQKERQSNGQRAKKSGDSSSSHSAMIGLSETRSSEFSSGDAPGEILWQIDRRGKAAPDLFRIKIRMPFKFPQIAQCHVLHMPIHEDNIDAPLMPVDTQVGHV